MLSEICILENFLHTVCIYSVYCLYIICILSVLYIFYVFSTSIYIIFNPAREWTREGEREKENSRNRSQILKLFKKC